MTNFATLLNTITLPEFSDLVMKQFSHVSQKITPRARQLFIYDDLTGFQQQSKRYDEVDTETFGRIKREGANSAKARAGVGYNKTMTQRRYAMEIDITHEMRRFGNQHTVKAELTSLNEFISHREELNLSHVLAFCSSTSMTDMDGETIDLTVGDSLALLSTVHTLAFSSTTYSNRVSGDPVFSQGALELAENLAVSDVLSNFGERRVMNFNAIITSDDRPTSRAVDQVLQSTADVDAAHAGVVNLYKGKYVHIELPYLATTATGARDSTKRRWWFIAAIGQGVMGWQAYFGEFEKANMKMPTPGSNLDDGHNDNWTYGVRGAHGIAVLSGRGLIGSLPTSA